MSHGSKYKLDVSHNGINYLVGLPGSGDDSVWERLRAFVVSLTSEGLLQAPIGPPGKTNSVTHGQGGYLAFRLGSIQQELPTSTGDDPNINNLGTVLEVLSRILTERFNQFQTS